MSESSPAMCFTFGIRYVGSSISKGNADDSDFVPLKRLNNHDTKAAENVPATYNINKVVPCNSIRPTRFDSVSLLQ